MADGSGTRPMHLELHLDDEDVRLLRGALLAARAAELAEAQRRGARLSFGYGSDSAREDMTAEVVQARRRRELLDEVISALDRAADAGATR